MTPEFGYRFLADEVASVGLVAGRAAHPATVLPAEAVVDHGAQAAARCGQDAWPAVHDDHVQRNFTAQRADQVRVTDLTEHPTAEGNLYCCAIKDLFSKRIVGYAPLEPLSVVGCQEPAVSRWSLPAQLIELGGPRPA
jgi:putative transposase